MANDIKIEQRDSRHVACVRVKVPQPVGDVVGQLIGEVWGVLERAGIHPIAGPYARTIWLPGSDLEVGFPIAQAIAGDGRVVAGELPAGKLAVTTHIGPYDQLGPVYDAVRTWVEQQGLAIAALPWEQYLSDPNETPDPKDWRTEVVFPVR